MAKMKDYMLENPEDIITGAKPEDLKAMRKVYDVAPKYERNDTLRESLGLTNERALRNPWGDNYPTGYKPE